MAKSSSPDLFVRRLVGRKPNLLVPHFLIHSFLYYELDAPLVSDETFDWIVKQLTAGWENIEHPHKYLIDPTVLKSGFYLSYPAIVKGAAGELCALFGRTLTAEL